MADFLLEIGTEEIPDWMIEPALAQLQAKFQPAFASFGAIPLQGRATPRRLAVLAKGFPDRADDTQTDVVGPYISAGDRAAEGFARKHGTAVADLSKLKEGQKERYVFRQITRGPLAFEALSEKLPAIIQEIRFPKAMYWTKKGDIRFIRPIRWIIALLGDQVIPFEVAGVKSSNTTRGHRILGSKHPIQVTIDDYERVLEQNGVILRSERRMKIIEDGVGAPIHDKELLNTLVYLTEHPSVIRGSFDPSYLELPKEILSTVMRHHQRYFSVLKPDGSLAPQFIAVTNTDGDPDGLIRLGNERVLRARFNDARFFWQVDQAKKLGDRLNDLAKVTFQAKLGTYNDKTERVASIAAELAKQLGANGKTVNRAALLCKCDLTTDMVKEFTELQGVVGGLYAQAQGEGEAVATAVYDHYKPVSMEDSIPRTLEGQIVSLADKLDTLRECFKIDLIPTGSKDPFALRRAAQGVVKILFEARLSLDLTALVADIPELPFFLKERIQFYLRDTLNYAYDEVNAVLAAPDTTLTDLAERAEAIHLVRPTEDFEPLAASFKRIKNILKQAQLGPSQLSRIGDRPDPNLLSLGPEQDLYRAFLRVREAIRKSSSYRDKLAAIASLRPQVDLFFDKILVNDPDPAIRQNRLALLHSLLTEFSTIADFSEIVTQGASGA